MLPASIHKALLVLSVTAALTGCLAKQYIVHPPPPTLLPATPNPLFPPTESAISFPVQMNLAQFLATVNDENVIPKMFDHSGNPIKYAKGNDHKLYFERDDFATGRSDSYQTMSPDQGAVLRDWWKGIDLPGTRLHLTAGLRSLGVHAQTPAGKAPTDCGNGQDRLRKTTLQGSIAIGMTPNYGLSASVGDVAVNAIAICNSRVVAADFPQDVRNRLMDTIRGGLNHAVARLDANTVHPLVEEAWNGLRTPIQLEPNSWLLLNIDRVKHSGFSIDGQSLNDTLHVIAKPVIVFGPEPAPTAIALPPLDTQPASPGFHVVADIPLDYPSLSQSLAARLKGKRVAVKGDFIEIADAAILGRGGNQVVLRIAFGGDATGHLYFVGKPEMNTLTQSIQIGGLRLDQDSEQVLAKSGPHWLTHSSVRELVMGETVLGVTPAIERMRDLVTKALNRELSPTITTHGTVTSVQGIGVFADVNALHVRMMTDGSLSLKADGKQ
ncbi:MAG TPA: DUF4403 family protein [Nitrospira sp.]|nr:DUF4403 family protein [Nitrospira sp.]